MSRFSTLLATTALFLPGSPLLAQGAVPSLGAADTATPAATAPDSGGLADIVVTAQRRSENLQRVPIAVVAASGATLKNVGVVTTEQLNVIAPGLNIRTTVGAFQPYIRGIGTSSSVVENPVALYIDGVYLPQQREGVRELNDIEQVAVLKGPQGTLFGRNSTGGVIQITTRAPSFTPGYELNGRYENYNFVHGDVYATGPMSSTLAYSLSASVSHQGVGWGKDLGTGHDTYRLDHQYGARAKLLFKPDVDTSVTLIADYLDRYAYANSFQPYPGTTFGFDGLARPDGSIAHFGPVSSVYDTTAGRDSTVGFEGGGVSLTAEHKFSFAKIVSISAYRHGNGSFSFDNSGVSPTLGFVHALDQPSISYTQELQIISNPGGQFNWVVGLYYFHYKNAVNDEQLFRLPPFGNTHIYQQAAETTESVAPFAQFDWRFLDHTTLTAGIRYSHETRDITGTLNPNANLAALVPGPAITPKSLEANKPTFRVALNQEVNNDISAYVSFNRGFKSGGFNTLAPAAAGYLPETLNAYEVGIKSQFLDRRVRLNLAGFYYDYTNIQVSQIVAAGQITVNGAKARLYGLDVDLQARLTDALRLTGGLSLLNATFTSYPNAPTNLSFTGVGAVIGAGDASGKRLPLAQKVSGTAALDYTVPANFGEVQANVTANYNGSYYFEPDNFLRQGAYVLLNASLKVTLAHSGISLSVFGRNLLDKKVISQANSQNFLGYQTAYGNAPRTYGISAQYKF